MSDHKLWLKIKEQGIESQNAEYWGSTKTRHFCGWTTKIYNSAFAGKVQVLSAWYWNNLQKLIPTSANCKLSKLHYCHMSLPIDARCQKVRKTSRKSTMCCLLQQKNNYYIWLICLLYRIVGYKKRPQICKKQKITYHLPA